MQLFALFRLAFAPAPGLLALNLAAYRNSPVRSTKSTRSLPLPLLVNTGFQVLFHSPPGVLFTFPSRYYALSVTKKYLALGGGPPCFPPGFTCLVVLWVRLAARTFRLRGFYSLWRRFPTLFLYVLPYVLPTLNPAVHAPRFGLCPVRSPLLRKSIFLSLPPGT